MRARVGRHGARLSGGEALQEVERPVVDFHQFVATSVLEKSTTTLHKTHAGSLGLRALCNSTELSPMRG